YSSLENNYYDIISMSYLFLSCTEKKQVNKYREWIYSLVLSIFLELEIEDPKVLSSLFLNIIDGLIIDGTINKPEINSEETWSYINKLIELETKQKYEAA
ncbi:hypothetical protein ABTH66_17415, partial [Acinetobacter baumannii]